MFKEWLVRYIYSPSGEDARKFARTRVHERARVAPRILRMTGVLHIGKMYVPSSK